MQRLGFVKKRRLDQNENSESDVVLAKKSGSAPELVGRQPFVQFLQDLRMRRFQAHGDFQPLAGAASSNVQRVRRAHEPTRHPSKGAERGSGRCGGVPLLGWARNGSVAWR